MMLAQTDQGRFEIRKRGERKPRPLRGGYHFAGLGGGLGIGITIGSSGVGATPPPGSTGGPVDPLTIATGATPQWGFSADVGTSEAGGVGTGVDTWTDQGGSGFTATQATQANRPTIVSSALNTHKALHFTKASAQRLTIGTWNAPAPGTTPTFICGVMRLTTLAGNDSPFGGGASTTMRMLGGGATSLRLNGGANGSTVTVATGTWYWFEAYFANSTTTDYIRVGLNQAVQAGTSLGNNDPAAGAFTFGAQQSAGTNPADFDLCCVFAFNAIPTNLTTPTTGIRAWATGYYSGTLVI